MSEKKNFKLKINIPFIGFAALVLSVIFVIVALCMYLNTYKIAEYKLDRVAVVCAVLSIWFLLFLTVNSLFKGDKPVWTCAIYALIAFLIIYGMISFLQPCLTPIGFVLGAGDLNMGDVEKNRIITDKAITTAVFYVLSLLFLIVAAFSPTVLTLKTGKKSVKNQTASGSEVENV